MLTVIVRAPNGGVDHLPDHVFLQVVDQGRMHPATPVSVDGGQTFVDASVMASRLRSRGDDGFAAVLPSRVETWSFLAAYLALFSLLFFGGPFAGVAAVIGFDAGPKVTFRLAMIGGALLLGPGPIALVGWLGLRAIRRDPTYRGKGRAIFALVVAALMLVGCLVGIVGVVSTVVRGH